MSTLTLDTERAAIHITVTREKLSGEFTDSRRIVVPLAWYPGLMHDSFAGRQNWQLLGENCASDGPSLTNTSKTMACSREGAAVKVSSRLSVGSRIERCNDMQSSTMLPCLIRTHEQ